MSIAVTRAPCSASATVDDPVPQPISSTRKPSSRRTPSSQGMTVLRSPSSPVCR
jgi:hypothetical protein